MLPSQGSKIQGWERVAGFSSSTEVLLLLWRRRMSNLSIICLFTDGTTKIIWTRCELFFAKTTNFHFPECEKLKTDNANQQLSLSLSRVWKTEEWQQCRSTTGTSTALSALELISKLGTLKTHRCYTVPIKHMYQNVPQCLFNNDLLPRLKMDEMVATLSLTGRSPTSTLQRWGWSWYIYHDEVSVCHENDHFRTDHQRREARRLLGLVGLRPA